MAVDGIQPLVPENPILVGQPPVRKRALSESALEKSGNGSDASTRAKGEKLEPGASNSGDAKALAARAERSSEANAELDLAVQPLLKRPRTVTEILAAPGAATAHRPTSLRARLGLDAPAGAGAAVGDQVELVRVAGVVEHEVPLELQVFYKELTEACVGASEERRTEALGSLASDPALHLLLPRLTTFIAEGVCRCFVGAIWTYDSKLKPAVIIHF